MPGRADPSRDLRFGLLALEGGTIDREQLIAAVGAWARSPDRTMAEILDGRGLLDAPTIARLEERVDRELAPPGVGPVPFPGDATATFAVPVRPADLGDGDVAGDEEVASIAGHRFEVLRPHARGGLGEVFIAFDRELNRRVALKELQARLAHDPAAQDRFLLEAEVTGSLEHPGIVPVYSLGRYPDGRPYYAMHLIRGETLRDAIERFHRKGGGEAREPAFRRLLRSVIDACNAVAYAHSRGVVHRDLKPENVMLGRFGETLVVDWGVAKRLDGPRGDGEEPPATGGDRPAPDASMTRPGSLVGTPRYMSPEQAEGDLDRVGPASDVYGLGAILYCVLVGHGPFPDGDLPSILERARRGIFPSPRRLRRSVDPALEAICLKAMAVDPRDRYASALDLTDALEGWLSDVRYRGEQEHALSQAKGSLARLSLERAHQGFGRGSHGAGMLWLARALENAPDDPPELGRLIRTSLHGWHSGAQLLERAFRHGDEVHDLAFCPEGRRLATACGDRAARIWDVSTGSTLADPMRHDGPVRAVAFSPDGTVVATSCDDGMIRLWDALTGAPVGAPIRLGVPAASLRFSPDGSRIAAGGPGQAFLLEVATGRPAPWPAGDGPPVVAVAFAPDLATVAVACDDGGVRIGEAATGKPLGEPLAHDSAVRMLGFDPGGGMLLTADLGGAVRVWDLARRVAVATLSSRGEVLTFAFRPGGDAFAMASADGTARLWETVNGRPIGEPLDPRSRVDCLAFRPDGTLVATGSPDGTVRLWCAATGLPTGPPLTQGGAVRTLAFSHDGRRLVTAGSDAMVRCWEVPSPLEGAPERVSCWVRVTTDLEFDEGDAIRRMDGPTSWDLRRRLTELGGPPPPVGRSSGHAPRRRT